MLPCALCLMERTKRSSQPMKQQPPDLAVACVFERLLCGVLERGWCCRGAPSRGRGLVQLAVIGGCCTPAWLCSRQRQQTAPAVLVREGDTLQLCPTNACAGAISSAGANPLEGDCLWRLRTAGFCFSVVAFLTHGSGKCDGWGYVLWGEADA